MIVGQQAFGYRPQFNARYRVIHKKGSDDVASDVCYTIYTIYLSLCTQTAETTSPELCSRIPL